MGGEAELGELDAFGSFAEGPVEGLVSNDVFEEEFPLDLEGIVALARRDFFPAFVKVDRAVDVGVPNRNRCVLHGLGPALA